jgi:hypothetical protein
MTLPWIGPAAGLQQGPGIWYDRSGWKTYTKERVDMDQRRQGRTPFFSHRQETPKEPNRQFDEFEASSLFCPKCKRAVPVRKRLLLVLPEGERYEYLCSFCSSSIGRKLEEVKKKIQLIHTR